MDTHDSELKKELNATLQARRELGEEYDSALVDSFLDKIDQRLDGRNKQIRRELAEQQLVVARGASSPRSTHEGFGERHGFGIVSLVLAVPLSAIAGSLGHLAGLLVAWVGILGVNMVHSTRFGAWARSHRKSERDD